MNKRTKKVIALAAAVASLGASLGVASETVQAADQAKPPVKADTVKAADKAKAAPAKAATQLKQPAASKTGNQIKWEKPK
ncbi:MAG: hypothetical protein FDX18_08155 [Chlorobium sp.]|nr:MAG: hypothetical protein FDX18_08155 [Chlorobium sp.]